MTIFQSLFSSKMDTQFRYAGTETFYNLTHSQSESFTFINEQSLVNKVTTSVVGLRDIHVLEENLGNALNENVMIFYGCDRIFSKMVFLHLIAGSFQSSYYLSANTYISERMMGRIDKVAGSMMENGLYRFYNHFAGFTGKLQARKFSRNNETQLDALKFSDLQSSFIFCTYIVILAAFFFLIEIILCKLI